MPVTSRIADTAEAPTTPAHDQGRYTRGEVAAEALKWLVQTLFTAPH